MAGFRETELYAPTKAFLERQGFAVKGEVADADVVACRGDEPPVIVELKAGFCLALLHQAVARLAITDAVYVCVPQRSGRIAARALHDNLKLCRRLGLGVMTVRLSDGLVEVHCDPGPYAPRKSRIRQERLLKEFARRRDAVRTGHGLSPRRHRDRAPSGRHRPEQGGDRRPRHWSIEGDADDARRSLRLVRARDPGGLCAEGGRPRRGGTLQPA